MVPRGDRQANRGSGALQPSPPRRSTVVRLLLGAQESTGRPTADRAAPIAATPDLTAWASSTRRSRGGLRLGSVGPLPGPPRDVAVRRSLRDHGGMVRAHPPHHHVLHVRAVPRPPGAAVSAQEPAALAPREHDDSIALAIRAAFDHEGSSGSGIRAGPPRGARGGRVHPRPAPSRAAHTEYGEAPFSALRASG